MVDVAENILKSYAKGRPMTLKDLQAATGYDVTSVQELLTNFGIPTRMIDSGQEEAVSGDSKACEATYIDGHDTQDNAHHETMKINTDETQGFQTSESGVQETRDVIKENDNNTVTDVMTKAFEMTNDDVSNDSYKASDEMTNVVMDDNDGSGAAKDGADDDGTTTTNILLSEDVEEEEVIEEGVDDEVWKWTPRPAPSLTNHWFILPLKTRT